MDHRNLILKTLFLGPINGNLKELFAKLDQLNKNHGPFDSAFCAGPVFRSPSENSSFQFDASIKSPIPLYILGPDSDLDAKYYANVDIKKGGEIMPNVIYMGRSGIYELASGLTVAYISKSKTPNGWMIEEESVNLIINHISKRNNFKGVDYLITPVWPRDVLNGVAIDEKIKQALLLGDSKICLLAKILKPRYHLADMNLNNSYFYERQPYRNHKNGDRLLEHVTRFVNLSSFNSSTKDKWLYAIKISPLCVMSYEQLTIQPSDVTENPYIMTSHNASSSISSLNVTDDISDSNENVIIANNIAEKMISPDCWFCLSNPKLEKHLIVHVANYNYLTLAKGGLVPYHVLICPITHYNCLVGLDEETYNEIQSFKEALAKMFKRENMSIVVYDRNYHSQHLQLQIVPMHKQNPRFLCQAFIDYGKKCNMDFIELQPNVSIFDVVTPSVPYFYVEFEDGIRILHIIKGKIPIQFAREVLSSSYVLALGPDRVDWKNCVLGYKRESNLTKELITKFTPFCRSI